MQQPASQALLSPSRRSQALPKSWYSQREHLFSNYQWQMSKKRHHRGTRRGTTMGTRIGTTRGTTKASYRSQSLAALALQSDEVRDQSHCLVCIVNSTWFEVVIVLLNLLNCIAPAPDAQFVGTILAMMMVAQHKTLQQITRILRLQQY